MLLTGHKSRAIFDRYNIIPEQELLDAGDQLVAYLAQQTQAVPARRRAPPRPAAPPPRAPHHPSASCDAAPRKGARPPGTAARRCCTNRHRPARCPPTGSSPADAIRHWSAEGGHPMQDLAAEDGLTPLPSWTPGAKAITDDGRVAEERVLHPALTMGP